MRRNTGRAYCTAVLCRDGRPVDTTAPLDGAVAAPSVFVVVLSFNPRIVSGE